MILEKDLKLEAGMLTLHILPQATDTVVMVAPTVDMCIGLMVTTRAIVTVMDMDTQALITIIMVTLTNRPYI